ncbi:MAG: TetR/AcrR family transcriptional regulator [Treponema sp.]|nr:TetR/AcrR family transcriptional regulator [Treponema sp.]
MAIIVEHDKRRKEILEKSLEVFAAEGYEDVTFQKIADRCGITRTTLYIYFNNKREIFLGSLKQVLSEMEDSIKEIVNDPSLSAEQALRKMADIIVDYCEKNIQMFSVLLVYLLQLKKSGVDTNEKVTRRVIRLRHLTSTLIIRGIQNGEFKNLNVHKVNELIYSLVESSLFRIAVLNQTNMTEIRDALNLVIDGFLNK